MAVNETTTTITRAVMKDVVFHCSLSHDIVTLVWIATFRLHTAGLHKAMVSIEHVSLYVAPWLLVIGAFRTSLWISTPIVLIRPLGVPSAVRCGTDRPLCCLICIHKKYIRIVKSGKILNAMSKKDFGH